MKAQPKSRQLLSRYAWLIKFPLVLVTTLAVKLKNRSLRTTQGYLKHQQEIYGKSLFTDKTDKFNRVRERIAQLAVASGRKRALDVATGAGWQALALKEAGFSGAMVTPAGPGIKEGPYSLKRVGINRNNSMLVFRFKISGGFSWLREQKLLWKIKKFLF